MDNTIIMIKKYTIKSKKWRFNVDFVDENKLFKINNNIKCCRMEIKNIDTDVSRCLGYIELYQPENITWMKIHVHPTALFKPENTNNHTRSYIPYYLTILTHDVICMLGNWFMN